MDEEKAINRKLGDGLADVLLNMADDNLDDLNDDCEYTVVRVNFYETFLDKFFAPPGCATVLGITLMKQLNVRRCKRLRMAKGTIGCYSLLIIYEP